MGHIVRKNNNKLHLHFILSLLNLTKMMLKNRHKFKYPHLTYLTLHFTWTCMAFSSFVREIKEQLAWAFNCYVKNKILIQIIDIIR